MLTRVMGQFGRAGPLYVCVCVCVCRNGVIVPQVQFGLGAASFPSSLSAMPVAQGVAAFAPLRAWSRGSSACFPELSARHGPARYACTPHTRFFLEAVTKAWA